MFIITVGISFSVGFIYPPLFRYEPWLAFYAQRLFGGGVLPPSHGNRWKVLDNLINRFRTMESRRGEGKKPAKLIIGKQPNFSCYKYRCNQMMRRGCPKCGWGGASLISVMGLVRTSTTRDP